MIEKFVYPYGAIHLVLDTLNTLELSIPHPSKPTAKRQILLVKYSYTVLSAADAVLYAVPESLLPNTLRGLVLSDEPMSLLSLG